MYAKNPSFISLMGKKQNGPSKPSTGHQRAKSDQQTEKRHWYQSRDIASELQQWNLRIVEVKADGNCFFRAVSDQLEGSKGDHVALRQKTVKYIQQNSEDFEPYIEDGKTLDHYCKRMAEVPVLSLALPNLQDVHVKTINAGERCRMGHGRAIKSKLHLPGSVTS